MRHRNRIHTPGVAGLLAVLLTGAGSEASGRAGGNIDVALLSERVAVEPGRPFHVGLRMRIRRGWHTYWKNPGDSGLPLRITWNLPEGFSAGPIEWPAPERIPENELVSYGYSGEVLFPIEITPPARLAVDSVTIAGDFGWLECEEVCVPGASALKLSLPVRSGSPASGSDAPLFAKARSRLPKPPVGWTFSAEAGPRAISLRLRPPEGVSPRGGYLFVDRPLVVDYAAPQSFERVADGYRLTMTPAPNSSGPPERLTGVLVLEGRGGARSRTALQVDVPVSIGDPAPAPVPSEREGMPVAPYVALFAGLGVALFMILAMRRKKTSPPQELDG